MSSSPNSASSRNAAALAAASAAGQNDNNGNDGNGNALQLRGNIVALKQYVDQNLDPLLEQIQRRLADRPEVAEVVSPNLLRLRQAHERLEEGWTFREDIDRLDRRIAEAEAEQERRAQEEAEAEAQAEAQALLDAQAQKERDDKLNGLLSWVTDLQLETKSLRAKVERLEEELAEVRGDAGTAPAGGGDADDREE